MNPNAPLLDDFSGKTIIDRMLEQQADLTAVQRFAQKHERAEIPLQAQFYQDLIPLTKPAPGQQYAFQVNLDVCTGCKACVSACHSLNGLESGEAWRDIGLLVNPQAPTPYQQTVTTACHHCADPGCLNGCPVVAYEKDPSTGIVRHLDDQCIGCQYCTMKCPYDVPKYSERLGIVRKCDMCHDRLAANEAPACVQACPHEAIQITIVDTETVKRESTPGAQIIPGAFDSSYTQPTTRYITKKPVPASALSADHATLHLEHAHWPLVVMLVLSQLAVGILVTLALVGIVDPATFQRIALVVSAGAFVVLNIGLACATLHLGRPLGAWRFFLGLRTSWMSREIAAFSLLAGTSSLIPPAAFFVPHTPIPLLLTLAAAGLGTISIFTSVMIYVDTHRTFWSFKKTSLAFFGTAISLGAIAVLPALPFGSTVGLIVSIMAILTTLATSAIEQLSFKSAFGKASHPWNRSARVIGKLLPNTRMARLITAGASAAPLLLALTLQSLPLIISALLSGIASAILERYIFFTAVVPYRMPGGVLGGQHG